MFYLEVVPLHYDADPKTINSVFIATRRTKVLGGLRLHVGVTLLLRNTAVKMHCFHCPYKLY